MAFSHFHDIVVNNLGLIDNCKGRHMNENKEFQKTIDKFENQMVDAESKLGINPLELWMNEMISRKRNQNDENKEEQ